MGQSAQSKMVLIVGEVDAAMAMEDILQRQGISVESRSTPIGASELIQKISLDAVIIDLELAGTDPERLITSVRKFAEARQIPVVLVGPESELELEQLAARLKCAGHVPSAHLESDLIPVVRSAMTMRRAPQAASQTDGEDDEDEETTAFRSQSQFFAERMRMQIRFYEALSAHLDTAAELLDKLVREAGVEGKDALTKTLTAIATEAEVLELDGIVKLMAAMKRGIAAHRSEAPLAASMHDALAAALEVFARNRTEPDSPAMLAAIARVEASVEASR